MGKIKNIINWLFEDKPAKVTPEEKKEENKIIGGNNGN